MVEISFNDGKLITKFYGDNFREIVDICKLYKFSFDKNDSYWKIPFPKLEPFLSHLKSINENVSIDLLAQNNYNKWKSSLNELKLSPSRLLFNQSLLKFPPLKGKPPNEDFQYRDILRALHQNRFLFNHEMGLGKSYILTALIEHLRYYKLINKCLVFSSGIGVINLKNEILKFSTTLSENDILSFTSATELKFEDRDLFNTEKYPQKIIIMPYNFLKSISNYYYDINKGTKKNPHPSNKTNYQLNFLPMSEWIGDIPAALFLDENHNLAHPKSRRTQIVNRILPYFEYRYLFTGTLADTYEKLYEPLMILDKNLVNGLDYQSWVEEHNEVGNRYAKYAVNPNKWNLEKIGKLNKELLNKYGSKRKMIDCLDLPLNFEVPVIYTKMSELQRQIYESFSNHTLKTAQSNFENGGKSVTDQILNLFPYIQLAIDNPTCLIRNNTFCNFSGKLQNLIKQYSYERDNTKVQIIKDIVEENSGELGNKGIIWYYHPETEKALTKILKKYNPYVINIDIPKNERIPLVTKFLSDPKSSLIIASINILNTSVTMTECKYEVYVEKTYNYTTYKQSRGRIHRSTQKDITKTYSIRFENSMDNLQELNLIKKGEVINSLMNKEYIEHNLWKKLFNLSNADDTSFYN